MAIALQGTVPEVDIAFANRRRLKELNGITIATEPDMLEGGRWCQVFSAGAVACLACKEMPLQPMHRRVDHIVQPMIWIVLLLVGLATNLSMAGMPLGNLHGAEETALSPVTNQSVCIAAPNDGAILPTIYLLDIRLDPRPAQIERCERASPSQRIRRPATRAPPAV
jgi:hypothetical protein